MTLTNFDPKIHGFHFGNTFVNHIIGDIVTRGLCGGMAFASLDYYFAGMPIPTHVADDFPSGGVPAEGSVLRRYIFKRMMNSVERNAAQWLNVVANPVFGAKRFTKRHLDDLIAEIKAGRPAPLGLVGSPRIIGAGEGNHQVVCYGYDLSDNGKSITLFIYDNNYPDQEVTLTTNPMDPETITYSTPSEWVAFFMAKYKPERPEYIDLALNRGITLDLHGPVLDITEPVFRKHQLDEDGRPIPPSHAVAHFQECGKPMGAHYTVRNFGEYPARLRRLLLKMKDPSGDETSFATTDVLTIAAGGEIVVGKDVPVFPNEPGGYDLRAEYVNWPQKTIRLPLHGVGTDNDVQFSAVPAGTTLRRTPATLTHA